MFGRDLYLESKVIECLINNPITFYYNLFYYTNLNYKKKKHQKKLFTTIKNLENNNIIYNNVKPSSDFIVKLNGCNKNLGIYRDMVKCYFNKEILVKIAKRLDINKNIVDIFFQTIHMKDDSDSFLNFQKSPKI